MPRLRTNLALEEACRLDLYRLLPTESRSSAGELSWTRGGRQLLSARYDIFLSTHDGRLKIALDRAAECLFTIPLVTTSPHLGGLRWWMVCPKTGKRAGNLYLFEDMETFCHRTAIAPTPTYKSQRQTPLVRVTTRLARVIDALGWTGGGDRGRPKLSPSRTTRSIIQALRLKQRKEDILEKLEAKMIDRLNRNDTG